MTRLSILVLAAFASSGCANDVPAQDEEASPPPSSATGYGTTHSIRAIAKAVSESGGSLDVLLQLSPRSHGLVIVEFMTSDGTAKAGADYEYAKGQVQFNPGRTEQTIRIPLVDDDVAESSEFFILQLHVRRGAELAEPRIELVINDDD